MSLRSFGPSFAFALGALAPAALALPLQLNDLSVLLPLPPARPPSGVPAGIPPWPSLLAEVRTKVPSLRPDAPRAPGPESLRLVALRVDPCFPLASGACQPMLRLVWQPVFVSGGTMDAAIHTLHRLADPELRGWVAFLVDWGRRFAPQVGTGGPLWIHPALTGPQAGAAAESLRAALGRANGALWRMTFMTVRGNGNRWDFGGFERVSAQGWADLPIPGIATPLQTFEQLALPPTEYRGGLSPTPAPQFLGTLGALLADSSQERQLRQAGAWRQRIEAIEDPRRSAPHQVDCASCHAARAAHLWTERTLRERGQPTPVSSPPAPSRFDLTNHSPRQEVTLILRGMGYFGTQVALSRRVILETARAIEILESRR